MFNNFFILLLLFNTIFSESSNFPMITILGSANVHGEIEPCG